MNYTLLGITIISSLIISVVGFKLLRNNSIFHFLKKKNTKTERWASQTKPIYGGIIFYVSSVLAIAIALIAFGFETVHTKHLCVFVSVSLAFFMGIFDDIKNQGPLKKFITQILCATILILCGIHIETSDNALLNNLLTYLWVVGIMNSINMLDNMDAITGIVTTTILTAISGIVLFSGAHNMIDAIILVSVITSLCVYLYWNWHPSKMYMGDNGSQFLGIILAIFSIQYIWNASDTIAGINYENFILIALAFALPLIDTAVVFINRLAAGKSPFVGDKFHTTHNLVYMGLTEKGVARLFGLISIISNSVVFYIIVFTPIHISSTVYIFILIYIGIISLSFFIISRYVKKKHLY